MTILAQKRGLWITLAGAFVILLAFAITVYGNLPVGAILSLIGALILLTGAMKIRVASKHAESK